MGCVSEEVSAGDKARQNEPRSRIPSKGILAHFLVSTPLVLHRLGVNPLPHQPLGGTEDPDASSPLASLPWAPLHVCWPLGLTWQGLVCFEDCICGYASLVLSPTEQLLDGSSPASGLHPDAIS